MNQPHNNCVVAVVDGKIYVWVVLLKELSNDIVLRQISGFLGTIPEGLMYVVAVAYDKYLRYQLGLIMA